MSGLKYSCCIIVLLSFAIPHNEYDDNLIRSFISFMLTIEFSPFYSFPFLVLKLGYLEPTSIMNLCVVNENEKVKGEKGIVWA